MMLFHGAVDIPTIPAAEVRDYLLRRGWVLKPFPRKTALYFEGPLADDGEPIVQLLPVSETLHDYPRALEDLLRALSVLEERSIAAILQDLRAPSTGVLPPPTNNGMAPETKPDSR